MKDTKAEVEYKQKSGTAWSHSYLNQKPWHPLSYPNQRRKWIAEQQTAQKDRKADEVAREFAQEQEFFRQTAEMSKREKEKVEALQAVGFMYMRPPGYNAESARAAEIADERKKLGLDAPRRSSQDASLTVATQSETGGGEAEVKRKPRVKDVFGRNVATEEEFPALKDAPKMDTGIAGRVKPFAIEIRNVKCAKCGAFGHQSGDRECPLKDVITPSEVERLRRNDPLNIIIAQATSDEPFKWELKQQPGAMSPARGGFRKDHPNQQILADEEIYDEYGGFLAGGDDGDDDEGGNLAIPNILASLTEEQRRELAALRVDERRWKKEDRKKKRKKRKQRSVTDSDESDRKEIIRTERRSQHRNRHHKHDKKRSTSELHKSNKGHGYRRSHSDTSSSDTSTVPGNKDTVSGSRIISSRKSSKVVDDDTIVESRGQDHQNGSRSHSRHGNSRGTRGSSHRKEKDGDFNREEKRVQGSTLDELHERFKKQRETDHRQKHRLGSSEH